jgi:SAM-dependent methyltransferase
MVAFPDCVIFENVKRWRTLIPPALQRTRAGKSRSNAVPSTVDLYNSSYANYEAEPYRRVRLETYGADYGQTSWVTMRESEEIPQILGMKSVSHALEVGCGSGRYALHLAETVRCRLTGIDINASGIHNANRLASASGLSSKIHFEQCDASKTLPFDDHTFDAVFSNDVLCHIPGRPAMLRELFRILKPGGGILFSDALVIGGLISHEEIAARSSVGFYIYSPPGENERLITEAGFSNVHATDTTESAATISKRWHDARERYKKDLCTIEGAATFDGLQNFLSTVHTLTAERRLRRYIYHATRRVD